MTYSVVETIEKDGTKSVCSVRKNWVIINTEGEAFVYWPPKNFAIHLGKQCSPEKNWKNSKCIILKTNIGKTHILFLVLMNNHIFFQKT